MTALTLLNILTTPAPTYATTPLWLPTPPGETWRIMQGYQCGTHTEWGGYALDLVRAEGQTRDAPVYAAADGAIWRWIDGSGSLLIRHDATLYTMYTHLDRAVSTKPGTAVRRGTLIGYVGERGTPGNPHLHFTAFTGFDYRNGTRQSFPLSFADGGDLPDIGGCNQHGGKTLVAAGAIVQLTRIFLPSIASGTEPQPPPVPWYVSVRRAQPGLR